VGFFPLDRRLKLVDHHWTPETLKGILQLGVEIASYRRAAEAYTAVTKMALSKSGLQRLAEATGVLSVEALVAMMDRHMPPNRRALPVPNQEALRRGAAAVLQVAEEPVGG
jgi:hypothetical protein